MRLCMSITNLINVFICGWIFFVAYSYALLTNVNYTYVYVQKNSRYQLLINSMLLFANETIEPLKVIPNAFITCTYINKYRYVYSNNA